jgi:hypothetical protein
VVHRQFRGIFEDREPPSTAKLVRGAVWRYGCVAHIRSEREAMNNRGITTGGIIVILGIILIIVWSFWIGLIVTLIGLIAFGGFARGKWY